MARALPPGTLALFVLMAAVTAACSLLGGGGEPQLGSATTLGGNAVLVCSQACAERAQCGVTAERGTVVLLSSFGRVTRGHDMAIPENTSVFINDVAPEAVAEASNPGQPFTVNYYQITTTENRIGWVAGWCIRGQ